MDYHQVVYDIVSSIDSILYNSVKGLKQKDRDIIVNSVIVSLAANVIINASNPPKNSRYQVSQEDFASILHDKLEVLYEDVGHAMAELISQPEQNRDTH